MAYTLCFNLALGGGNTGLSLEAQLVDASGSNVGSAITSGMHEIGGGNYLWTGSIPDGHQGGVKFQIASGGALKAFTSINPQDNLLDLQLAELGVGTPAASPTLEGALMLLYMALRNRMDTTATDLKFYNDAGTMIAQAALSDDGTTFTRAEMA